MEKERFLKEIQANIRIGNEKLASTQITELANLYSDDPFMLLTCASLMSVVGDKKDVSGIVRKIPDAVKDKEGSKLEVVKGLRGIGYSEEAETILSDMKDDQEVIRLKAAVLSDTHRYSEAIEMFDLISEPSLSDRISKAYALSGDKRYDQAIGHVREMMSESPDDQNVKRCFCSVLVASGDVKEAEKFIKDNLKKDKSSPDANALAACFLWLIGKSANAGAYASKAVRAEPENLLGMEILAYTLIDKNKIQEARIVAGAINENDPGNPAVLKILDMCRILGK